MSVEGVISLTYIPGLKPPFTSYAECNHFILVGLTTLVQEITMIVQPGRSVQKKISLRCLLYSPNFMFSLFVPFQDKIKLILLPENLTCIKGTACQSCP